MAYIIEANDKYCARSTLHYVVRLHAKRVIMSPFILRSYNLKKLCIALLFYFSCLIGTISALATLLNGVVYWEISHWYINIYFLIAVFAITIYRLKWGLTVLIFLLPLSVGLGFQLNAHLNTSFMLLPNPGMDLVSGFLIGLLIKNFATKFLNLIPNNNLDSGRFIRVLNYSNFPVHYLLPVYVLNLLIVISASVSISRNLYQSASSTSMRGLVFNLIYFRPIDWHDDFVPIIDLLSYTLGFFLLIVVIKILASVSNKAKFIFRPIIAGLIIASFVGLLQSLTGMGLPLTLLDFRRDYLGYAAIGLQPDIHAYGGHMILGALGLLGYTFFSERGQTKLVATVILLSWLGLILSKSRSTFILAILGLCLLVLIYLYKTRHRFLFPAIVGFLLLGSIMGFLLLSFANSFENLPVLSWLGAIVSELHTRGFNSWSLWTGVFGGRFEIWEGALRMWSNFPIFGVGQGDFYRLSSIASFSRSHFLILNNGENAHNYFLQVLTETGVMGIIAFAFFAFYPFILSKNKTRLIPAFVALFSLSLANIFSHSFLVKENLYIGLLLFALLYKEAIKNAEQDKFIGENKSKKYFLEKLFAKLSIFILIVSGIYEIYHSYNKSPFEYGRYCFITAPIPYKNWTSGIFSIGIQKGSSGVGLDLVGPKINGAVIMTSEFISDTGERSGLIDSYGFSGGERRAIQIDLSKYKNGSEGGRLILKLSRCFTPRNQGYSIDSRRLGLYVNNSSLKN